ncbi:motility protein A [uncultured Sphingomonas sp.]|uniref:motility protein A n=1 Tax=uncultured Sphingomonas sp. TaxID=158754 RepID=UPI0035CC749A
MTPASFLDPIALALVIGGTILAAVLRTPGRDLARAVRALATLARAPLKAQPLVDQIGALSRIAQRHGVMALDRTVLHDPDLAGAVSDIVDGLSPDAVAERLEQRRQARVERHCAAAEAWAGAAEVAPAMGMVGTLVGLVRMFASMTDPHAIGAAMAVALLATLYGALLSNLLAAPIAARLRARARAEAFERTLLAAPLLALARREARPVPGGRAMAA